MLLFFLISSLTFIKAHLPNDTSIPYFPNPNNKIYQKFNHDDFKRKHPMIWRSEETYYEQESYKINQNIEQAWRDYKNEIIQGTAGKNCPKGTCDCLDHQILKDALYWIHKTGSITEADFEKGKKVPKITHYKIRKGKLYRTKNCYFPARCEGIEYFILKLLSKDMIITSNDNFEILPDMDFLINVRDFPASVKWRDPLPILSFSKANNEAHDILYPAWTFWAGGPAISTHPNGLGRWDEMKKDLLKTQENKKFPWSRKINKVFFRGSRTSNERDPLILLSRSRPDIINASYTKNQAFKSIEKSTLGDNPAKTVHLKDHCQYKFLFNFKGVAASFRHKHLFMCKSLVFHVRPKNVDDDTIEFYYGLMKPWVHYVPIYNEDFQLSNGQLSQDTRKLRATIDYFYRNDEIAAAIADEGFEYINEKLSFENILCYWRKLLLEMSEISKFELKSVDEEGGEFVEIFDRYRDEL